MRIDIRKVYIITAFTVDRKMFKLDKDIRKTLNEKSWYNFGGIRFRIY